MATKTTKHKAGRKTKYTPDTVKRITDAIGMGATYEIAAAFGGIHVATFYDWINKKSEFSDSVKRAEGVAAVGWLAKIEKAANDGNWQAAAWKLERRYPQQYGRTVVSNDNLNVDLSKLSDSQLERLERGESVVSVLRAS